MARAFGIIGPVGFLLYCTFYFRPTTTQNSMKQTKATNIRKGLACFVKDKTYILTFALLLCSLFSVGQNINRQMVNQLLAQLKNSKPDQKRVAILLELGKFQIFKPGEAKSI